MAEGLPPTALGLLDLGEGRDERELARAAGCSKVTHCIERAGHGGSCTVIDGGVRVAVVEETSSRFKVR